MHKGWIGVDLDGTLAQYDGWKGVDYIGEPVPAMVARVKTWLAEGREVRIMTARVSGKLQALSVHRDEAMYAEAAINRWCRKHLGQQLPLTCVKDYSMVELWDDRAVQIIPNTGQRADGAQ